MSAKNRMKPAQTIWLLAAQAHGNPAWYREGDFMLIVDATSRFAEWGYASSPRWELLPRRARMNLARQLNVVFAPFVGMDALPKQNRLAVVAALELVVQSEGL